MRKSLLIVFLVLGCLTAAAQRLTTDSVLFSAYLHEDMGVWKAYIDHALNSQPSTLNSQLLYAYGYCGYIVAEAKKEGKESLLPEAKRYVQNFKSQVEQLHSLSCRKGKGVGLPAGHYEMYMSAVYIFEMRLKESVHPVTAMQLAKEATRLAPNDPLVLSFYGTCLFYAPRPIGSKAEALEWFERAQTHFAAPEYRFSWVREANEMYIRQCREKLKKR